MSSTSTDTVTSGESADEWPYPAWPLDAWAEGDVSWDDWLAGPWSDDTASLDQESATLDASSPDASSPDALTSDTLTQPLSVDTLSTTSLLSDTTTVVDDPLAALSITVSGTTLSWASVSGVTSYVFVKKVSGLADQYSIVSDTSITPTAVPGQTVRYSVRTNVAGSAWAPEVSITYPVDTTAAPTLTVSGTTLNWTRIGTIDSYVLAKKVPNLATQYSIVSGLSATPTAVPGQTVRYSVRTNVSGSTWASEVSITYPADTTSTPDTTTTDPLAAPTLTVSGTTLKWNAVEGVSSYVLAKKVPNLATQYSIVSGTSTTPTAVPGQTVRYSVRTNVTGSSWAPEVSITYPSDTTTSTTSPQPIDGTFRMGVVAGASLSYELSFVKSLGAHTARLEFGIGTSAANMASTIDAYAKAGIRPLLLASFYGRLPTTAEAQNLAGWAAAYGPNGTFWQGKTYPAGTAVTRIEFGNETSYSYQFSDNSLSTYTARAKTYAQRAKEAANAVRTANANVGLVAIADNAVNGTAWVSSMFQAVPNLGDLVAGWTIHPYGPGWATRIDSTVNSTRNAGSRDLPIWVTEWGLSSDNGRCLDDNYGWNKCMTYAEAATTLHNVLSGMWSRYGSRLGAFYLYQAHDQYATGTSTARERYFGALQSNGTAKGAYTTESKNDLAAN